MIVALSVSALLAASPSTQDLEPLRAEAEALVRIQQTLDWYTRTVGETSIRAETYKGHEHLFSPATIRTVAKELKRPGLTADQRRALQFLRSYLALENLSLSTA